MNMKSYPKASVQYRMKINNFTEQFLADIAKQKENRERYERLSEEEKQQLKIEQERESECLNNVIEQITGSNPGWF